MTTEPVAGMANILKMRDPLPHSSRCCACGAQAWVEVEFNLIETVDGREVKVKRDLIFCAHDFAKHEHRLVMTATRIVDHRDALYRLEGTSDRR